MDNENNMIQWTKQYNSIQCYNTVQQTISTISNNRQYNTMYNDHNMIQYTMATIYNIVQYSMIL